MPMMMDPSARAQKRLDKLEKKLNLKPDQQAAWGTYKSAVLAQASERAAKMKAHHEQMKSGATKPAEMNAPQRMEEHAKHMREMADNMSRMAQNTQSLYQALTPEQRTIFDLMHQHRGMKDRMGMGMGHYMPGMQH
jgi:predicted RNase H-like nuclease (RuvC/YqgF family)